MLTELHQLPENFLECSANELHTILSGPTLIHLDGRHKEPLFVSVLLHGNEPTGLFAIQAVLKKLENQQLPRALSIFIGNVNAAQESHRHLENQPDYNRIWPCENCGSEIQTTTPEHAMMKKIVDTMRAKNVFASVDVHNNTGLNPHYGCVNKLDHRFFHLASFFSRTVVYFIRPKGVQSMAFADLCPAVTIECGKPDQPYGATHAADFINTCLHLSALPSHPVAAHDMDLFHTVATVKIPDDITFHFEDIEEEQEKLKTKDTGNPNTTIRFPTRLDYLNFTELEPGACIGYVAPDLSSMPVRVTDEHGQDATDHYFKIENGELLTVRKVMPSMFTLNEDIIRQDCLGYLMERVNWQS